MFNETLHPSNLDRSRVVRKARRRVSSAVAVAALSALSSVSSAATFVWDGSSTSGLGFFNEPDNWTPNGSPPNNGTADLIFGSLNTRGYNPTYGASFSVDSLTFNSGAMAFMVLNNSAGLTFTVGANGITDNATYSETLQASTVIASTSQTWNAANGTLNINGPVSVSSGTLTVNTSSSAGDVAISGALSGNGSLTKINSGTLTLSGSNQLAGTETVSNGTLNLNGGGTAIGTGGLTVSSGAICTVGSTASASGNITNNGSFNVMSSAAFSVGSNLFTQTAGSLTIAGSLSASNFTFNGGTINGSVQLNSSTSNTLTLGSSSTGNANFLFSGAGAPTLNANFGIPSGVAVAFQPASGSQYIPVSSSLLTNNGTLGIVSANSSFIEIQGSLTNNGTFNSSAGGTQSFGSPNMIDATFTNGTAGLVNILANTSVGGAVSNSGTITIPSGQTLSLPYAGETFTQTSGTLNIAGALTTPNFTFNGGTINGQVQLNSSSGSSTLTLGSSLGSGSGSFVFSSTGTDTINGIGGSGTIPANATVTLQPSSGFVNVMASDTLITNNGLLALVLPSYGAVTLSTDVTNNSVFNIGGSPLLNPSNAIAGLTNENAGVVNIDSPYAFGYAANYATFNISSGETFSSTGPVAFLQGAGTLNLFGSLATQNFCFSGGTVNFYGGNLNVSNGITVPSNALSPLVIMGGTVTAGQVNTSGVPGNFRFQSGSLTLTGAPVYVDSIGGNATTSSLSSTLTIASGSSFTVTNGNSELVGAAGIGVVNQTGGTNSVSTLSIGVFNTASGSYNLSGSGSLTVTNENVGLAGIGTFSQTGGTNNVGSLNIAGQAGHTDIYTLSNGNLIATVGVYIGEAGTGVFNQSGGTLTAGEIGLGTAVGGIGTANFTAGTTTVTGGLAIGGTPEASGGAGILNISGSAIVMIGGGLTVYDSPASTLSVGSGGSLSANSVTILGGSTTVTGTGVFNVGSGGLTFAGNDSPSLNTASGTLTLNGNVTFNGSAGTAHLFSSGTGKVDLGGTTRTFNIGTSSATVSMAIASPLTDGSLIKTGAGTLLLSATNTYTGSTNISQGTLEPGLPQALSSTSGVLVSTGATLDLNGQAIGNAPLILNGTGVAAEGALIDSSTTAASYGGAIALASNSSIGGYGAVTCLGFINGSGGLTIAGYNTVTLSGGGNFSGGVTVSSGSLLINQPISYTGGLSLQGGSIAVVADYDLGDPSNAINLSTGGTLEISNTFSTARSFNAAGGTLSVDSGQTLTSTGAITGSGVLNTAGAGTVRLTSASGTTGSINISSGTLSLSGPSGALPNIMGISVQTTGTLELNSSVALGGNQTSQNRVNDAAQITLAGGTLSLQGSSAAMTTETLGALTLQLGASTISVVDGSGSQSAFLTFASLGPHIPGATLAFDAPLPGTFTRLTFGSGVTAGQKMGGWITINGTDFAKYNASGGVVPFQASDYTFNSFTSQSDVQWTNATGNVPNVTISTLNLNTSNNNIALAQGGNTLTLSNSGLLQQGNGTATLGGGTLTSTSGELDISVNGTGTLNLNSTLSGSFVLTERGTGTLVLGSSSNNSYGGFTLASGNLNLNSNATAIFGTLIVDGGLVTSEASHQLDPGASVVLNSGTWNLNGKTETITSFTNNNGTMLFNGGTLNVTGSTNLAGGTTTLHSTLTTPLLTISGGTNQVEATAVSQVSVLLQFAGNSPLLQVSSDAAAPGKVQLSAGTFANPVNLAFTGTGTAALASTGAAALPGVLDLSGTGNHDVIVNTGSTLAISAAITDGGFEVHGGGTLQLTGANNYSGGTIISTATTLIAASPTALGASGSVVSFNGGMLALRSDSASATFPYSGSINGLGTSTAIDIDRLTPIAGVSSGTFTLNTMTFGSGNAGFSLTGNDGGTLVLGGTSGAGATIGYNSAAPGPAYFHTGANLTINGPLSVSGGSVDIIKDGNGTMTLAGSGTDSFGNTTINAGTLVLGKTSSAPAIPGNLSINSNSAVSFNQSNEIASTSTITLNAATGASLLNLNGYNNSFGSSGIGGLTFIAGGTLSTGTGTATLGSNVSSNVSATSTAMALIQGNLNLGSSARTFTVARGAGAVDMQISAAIAGSAGITKAGPGILFLSGASTFTGPIQINGGVLEASSAASLGNSSNSVTLDGGTLQFLNPFDPSANGGLALPASSALDTQGNTVPVAGIISGAGALTKLGSGTLVLEASNTFTGGFTLGAGTVLAGADSELGAAGEPIIFAGGTLALTTSFNTSRQFIVNSSGGTLNASAGTITLSTAPAWAGNLTLSAGTLNFNITSGSPSVTGSSTLTILPSATVIDGGTIDPLHGSGGLVNVVNNSVTSFDVTTGAKAAGVISGIGNTNVSAGASLTATSIQQNMLFVNGNVTIAAQLPHNSSAGVSAISTLSIAGTSTLNLNNNDLIVHGETLTTVANQIIQSYNGGNWTGTGGITSLSAANNSTHLTTLGVIQNNQSGIALFNSTNPFDGQSPGVADILVKYTYYGDTNLDGRVDGSDYSRIDSGYLTHATGWFNGDFNYDGVINGSDYTLIDNAFNSQGASLQDQVANPQVELDAEISPAPASSPVPEPTDALVMVIGATRLLGRRRSHSRKG